MKKIQLIVFALMLSVGGALAQTAYNPFTQNIHFEPEPTVIGFSCGDTPDVVFTMGLTTAVNATQWQTNPLTITICVSGFTMDGPASTVVSGAYASNFDWEYDSFAPNCLVGVQKQTLIGTGPDPLFPDPLSSGEIRVKLKVPETSQKIKNINRKSVEIKNAKGYGGIKNPKNAKISQTDRGKG